MSSGKDINVPSKDLISRQTAIDAVRTMQTYKIIRCKDCLHRKHSEKLNCCGVRLVMNIVEDLPSVQPEQRWIPCSETIDIPENEVLCCDRYGNEMIGYLAYTDEQWLCESDAEMMYDTIAWMEKPKPWKGDAKCTNAR